MRRFGLALGPDWLAGWLQKLLTDYSACTCIVCKHAVAITAQLAIAINAFVLKKKVECNSALACMYASIYLAGERAADGIIRPTTLLWKRKGRERER